ncbi:MAG: helix-turn-helix domain-containing protein [Patescibacteria group bacterium]
MDISIQKSMRGLGLGDKESRVYLALLELGKGTVSEIAKKAEIKRAITYHVLDDLIVQGYVQEILGEKVKKFSASDPLKIFQNAKSALEDFKFMLPVIRSLQSKKGNAPKIEFYDTPQAVMGIYRIFDEAPTARFLSSIERVNNSFPQELKKWLRGYKSGAIFVKGKHLLSDTKIDREWGKEAVQYGQKVRILPPGTRMEMDFSITDGILAITSFDPLFIVVIQSESIAQSAAQLFDLAWVSGKEIV